MAPFDVLTYTPIVLILITILDYVRIYFKRGLHGLPGPFWARFTELYRVQMVAQGDAPRKYRDLHAKYGPIFRSGPNHVSISDPAMVSVIYGIKSKFYKVSPFGRLQAH
jgi:hypothetical protein